MIRKFLLVSLLAVILGSACQVNAFAQNAAGKAEPVIETQATPGKPPRNTDGKKGEKQPPGGSPQYTIEQAVSDRAQQSTLAFDAFAFLTGNFASDTFFPPGKVADFWGFQYLRDNDPSQMGHNTDFLTRASLNMLSTLNEQQVNQLVTLAKDQVPAINEYGTRRWVLINAFRKLLEGQLPAGTTGLDQDAVKAFSAELYKLDGEISYQRAVVMGGIINSLNDNQRAALDAMVGQGMTSWPDVPEPESLRPLSRDEKIAVMTYAGDMFSWYAGSVDADIYFCPERHGTYFGSFYLKDAPAVGNPGYSISTTLTGDFGEKFLSMLEPDQAKLVTDLVQVQKPYLSRIVEIRGNVAEQLRKFMSGGQADSSQVSALMQEYGQMDGAIVYNYAVNFAKVMGSLSSIQKENLISERKQLLGDFVFPASAYLYSQPVDQVGNINSDFLFK